MRLCLSYGVEEDEFESRTGQAERAGDSEDELQLDAESTISVACVEVLGMSTLFLLVLRKDAFAI